MIVPPLTMASTSLAVLHQGAVPVFADIHPETFTIDPRSIRERLTSRTRAIIPVAIYGVPPEMDSIMEIAAEHGLAVIEDAAQCFPSAAMTARQSERSGALGASASRRPST